MKPFAALLAAVLVALPLPAAAWDKIGHRVTGDLAERHLSGKARAEVRRILGTETLAQASTWPDDMRSDPAEFWRRTANPWHYVTVPTGEPYDPHAHAPTEGDAFVALERFRAVLKDPAASREDKQLALRFIVHIVGDLHQPFHAGRPGDRGGNDVKLTFHGEATNLHAVWDGGLIDRQKLSYTELSAWLSQRLTREQVRAWSQTDPRVWIDESVALREGLYPAGDKIGWDYEFLAKPIWEERLAQAGVRIAAYLNETFR